jgi:exopolyphosphatase/guanosine-5'-triphosphate,3'-diphosphate pyrophosphatase
MPGRPAPAVVRAPAAPSTLAVIDMGATAVRLVVAEHTAGRPLHVLEEASRSLLLGRDTFSQGVLASDTIESALRALEGFREIMNGYGTPTCRAVATSAVREARNSDTFLDRIRIRTGLEFEVISESEEIRLVYLSVRHSLEGHPSLKAPQALTVEVGGGGAGLVLLARGQPRQSGVFSLGAVRMRQSLGLSRHGPEQRLSLLRRYIANVIEEIRAEIPLKRVSWVIAAGGDARFAATQLVDDHGSEPLEIPREKFLAFCDAIEGESEERLVERYRLPAAEAETLVPALLVYRAMLNETAAPRIVVPESSLRAGLLLDMTSGDGQAGADDLRQQVLASVQALGRRYQYDADHGRAVMELCLQLFDQLQEEHGLGTRERLLLQAAAMLHDIGTFVSLRAHHKHSQYLLSASQIFGLSDDDLAVVSNIARYHRRGLPQKTHLPYIALDRQDRMIVNKLAAILRLANALDAEHLQKVREVRLDRREDDWILDIEGTGDLTMERMAAQARADMFGEVFGHRLLVRGAGVRA